MPFEQEDFDPAREDEQARYLLYRIRERYETPLEALRAADSQAWRGREKPDFAKEMRRRVRREEDKTKGYEMVAGYIQIINSRGGRIDL